MKTLLWLDDERDPHGDFSDWVSKYSVGIDDVRWVKNYDEFTQWIELNGLPYQISFDHDLADEHYAPREFWDEKYNDWAESQNFKEKTGHDCCKWLIDYCMDNTVSLPLWSCHSANPAGVINMKGILTSFMKFMK